MQPIIVFEDNHLLVVQKEPNVPTQKDASGDLDLHTQLKQYLVEKYDKPGDAYLGLVHRMDRPVGGLLVFAKTSKAAERLSKQVAEKTLKREYVCIVRGMPPKEFTLRDILLKDSGTNMVKIVPAYLKQGKEAVLHARTVKTLDDSALVAVRLETGRSHQIRVQMAGAGFPLLGDQRYGVGMDKAQIALWGMRLGLAHPISGQRMVFVAAPEPVGLWKMYQRELDLLKRDWQDIAVSQPLGE